MSADLMQDINGLIGIWQPRKAYHIGPNYLDDLKRFLQEQAGRPRIILLREEDGHRVCRREGHGHRRKAEGRPDG